MIASLQERLTANHERLMASEADRAARLEVIERQGAELGRIPALETQLATSEADRAARLEVIERQGGEIGHLRHLMAQVHDRLVNLDSLIGVNRKEALAGIVRRERWQHLRAMLDEASAISNFNGSTESAAQQIVRYHLDAYIKEIDRVNRAQPNAQLLDAIRDYNHQMIETLKRARSLHGKRLLDIGASPHGYALERALQLGVAEYVGIGLDVDKPVEVHAAQGKGKLIAMNAEQLDFEDSSFDLVISLSTFEHIGDVAKALAEIRRVLKPGGSALISFEPIWTCSYGHHLHHFGPVSRLMPDWAHLVWDKQEMLEELKPSWPQGASPSLDEAAQWVYESTAINRVGITQMREYFADCGMTIEWIAPLKDEPRDAKRLEEIAEKISLSTDDLMIKGLSVLLNKVDQDERTGNMS
jgi:SAM-dependent methyltransferase